MKEKEILENLRRLINQKRNEYTDTMNNHEVGSDYWNYCRGKKDLLEDLIAYIASQV